MVAGCLVAPSTGFASHGDGSYDLPLWFRWDRSVLDVLIVPPNHGQVFNGNGVLNGGDPNELTPFNSYLDAVEDSVADWDGAVATFGADWLRSGLVTNVYVVGRDSIPQPALTNPEIVIVSDETKFNTLGLAFNTRPCLVDNSKFFIQSFTYEDMFNINSQEYGHCLGLEHVVDNHPEHDAMAGIYVHQPGAAGTHLHCASNLDVLGLEAVFGRIFGRPSPDSVSIDAAGYATTTCGSPGGAVPPTTPPPSPAPSATPTTTPTPTPSTPAPSATPTPTATPTATPTPTPTPTPSATPQATPEPTPAPSATPEPTPTPTEPPVYDRSVSLRLRRHLVARGTVAAEASHCYDGVPVEIQRKGATGWSVVATTSTGGNGSFRLRIDDRRGRYRAVVHRAESDLGTCSRAASPRRAHAH